MIGIKTENDRKFQDIALLVDRDDFLKDLEELKKKYNRIKDSDLITRVEFIQNEVFQISSKYAYPPSYNIAIFAAVTKNEIREEDVKEIHSEVNLDSIILSKTVSFYGDENSIVLKLPRKGLSKKRLLEAYETIVKKMKLVDKPGNKHPLNLDFKSSVRDSRQWYWERKTNKTSTLELSSKYHREPNTIDKAISEYSKAVKSDV